MAMTGTAMADQHSSLTVRAEGAGHAATWMAWPADASIYGGHSAQFEAIQEAIGRLARAIAENEPVFMAAPAEQHASARTLCGPAVSLVDIPVDDMWARDSGPVFAHDGSGEVCAVDFNFNGWGGKQRHDHDGLLAKRIADHVGAKRVVAPLRGEGGGLEFDGDGTLLLTESSWVNENRNPGKSRAEVEALLKSTLGVAKVIWVPGVRGQDITDGHIDGFMRFVRPGLVMVSGIPGDTSVWGEALKEALAIMAASTDARGRNFEIVSISSATSPRSRSEDMLTSYANYYLGNGALYMVRFGDRTADDAARSMFERLFPDRRIVELELDPIYENGGGIHCVTQQQPKPIRT
jgi:agmatine deiminase